MSAVETLRGPTLRRTTFEELPRTRPVVADDVLERAGEIVESVRASGLSTLRDLAARYDGLAEDEPLVVPRAELERSWDRIGEDQRALLVRVAMRIGDFARAQRDALGETRLDIPGGAVGHTFEPVRRAGCYAPGGRHPLPSSVLMTVVPARVAGVERVVVASPRAGDLTRAAAFVAGADELLCVGGAQAVAALAFGVEGADGEGLEPVDLVVGPGNAYVTAAKKLVAGTVGIDMLAGPSELLVLADDDADPARVAADLLAQAEHDVDALPMLVASSEGFVQRVESELDAQLGALETRETARVALGNGFALVEPDTDRAIEACNRIAPEHLSIATRDAAELALRLTECGAAFVGGAAAEALGDYGVGPNHVLPTGGGARFTAGLSVLTFLRARTFVQVDREADARELFADAAELARLEGLVGHARSAELRAGGG